MDAFIEDQTFDKFDFTVSPPEKGDYDHCVFTNCNFASVNLSELKFIDCAFSGCNLSMAPLSQTVLRDVLFRDCKMLGVRFDEAAAFGLAVRFESCVLDQSSFYKTKMKKTSFVSCRLKKVDFTSCDLTQAIFDGCDLAEAVFEHTVLEKADLRTAFNYALDPEVNQLKKARFALAGVGGLLGKYRIIIE
jgi:fluoroquinolone resistance protein